MATRCGYGAHTALPVAPLPLFPLSCRRAAPAVLCQSSIVCTDDCVAVFNKLKLKKAHDGAKLRFIIYQIEGEQINIRETGDKDQTYDTFVEKLVGDGSDGAYGVFDYDAVTDDGRKIDRIVFIAWVPDTLKIRKKMLYGSSKQAFKQSLSGIHVAIQACDHDDIDEEEIKKQVK